jgi:hypothetical protein
MIPARFSVEYPRRCMDLLKMLEPMARERSLVGSFSLLVASSLFVVPFERLKKHPLREAEREPELYQALRNLRKQRFLDAIFWHGARPVGWRLSRIVTSVDDTSGWRDSNGDHPMSDPAVNTIDAQSAEDVLRVIRNALSHGNIVYLDETGFETHGAKVQYLAFLSRYEESEEQRRESETYRVLSIAEEGFLAFVKAWGQWLDSIPQNDVHIAA